MRHVRLLLITGLPGTGKTTLGRLLAARYEAPLIAKDAVKEPLLDVLGADSPEQSRALSTASFAVLFAMARELLSAKLSFVLEGNFRPGEHEESLRRLLSLQRSEEQPRLAQVLCRVNEPERLQRLAARSLDLTRHQGHRDVELAAAGVRSGDAFLEIPGERFLYDGVPTIEALDQWWCKE